MLHSCTLIKNEIRDCSSMGVTILPRPRVNIKTALADRGVQTNGGDSDPHFGKG